METKAAPVQNSLKPGKWLNSTCKMCLHSCGIRVHVTDDGIVTDESATFQRVTGGTPITLYVFALRAGQFNESIGGVARIGDRSPVVTRMWSAYEPIAVALHDMALTS